MASGSSSRGVNIPALKTAIYQATAPTAELDPKHVFYQYDFMATGIIPNNDINILLLVINGLIDDKLIKPVSLDGAAWRLRTVDEARKYKDLSPEQDMVYALIDEAGSDGIWTKNIKSKTGLHDAVFRQCIKHLESKNMISDMKSVEHPNRKMYIKANLRPSERATGGPWYSNGELDLTFIEQITQICDSFILQKSFYASRLPSSSSAARQREPKKSKSKMTAEEVKALRDKELGPRVKMSDVEKRKAEYDRMLPMPAGYNGYATCDEITHFLDLKGVSKTILTAMDVQQLLDIMVYDEKIERVRCGGDLWGYRTLRQSLRDGDLAPQNLLTEAPCGSCPVFDLCEEGGPVGPSNCEYFNDWLSL